MKTFTLEIEPKIQSGFIVPENYFEDFSANMMQKLPVQEPKFISIFARKKTWIYSVAALFIMALSIPFYTTYTRQSSEIEANTLENYIAYHTTVSDTDLVNLLDQQDIEKLNLDMDIEDITIENELSKNKNLAQYLLN